MPCKRDDSPSVEEVYLIERSDLLVNNIRRHSIFAGLVITLLTSVIILASHINGWVLVVRYQKLINQNQATMQILVQVLASILGGFPVCAHWCDNQSRDKIVSQSQYRASR